MHIIMTLIAIPVGLISLLFIMVGVFGKVEINQPASPPVVRKKLEVIARKFMLVVGACGLGVSAALANLSFLEAVGAITLLTFVFRFAAKKIANMALAAKRGYAQWA